MIVIDETKLCTPISGATASATVSMRAFGEDGPFLVKLCEKLEEQNRLIDKADGVAKELDQAKAKISRLQDSEKAISAAHNREKVRWDVERMQHATRLENHLETIHKMEEENAGLRQRIKRQTETIESIWPQIPVTSTSYSIILSSDGLRSAVDKAVDEALNVVGAPRGLTPEDQIWSCIAAVCQANFKAGQAYGKGNAQEANRNGRAASEIAPGIARAIYDLRQEERKKCANICRSWPASIDRPRSNQYVQAEIADYLLK
ncbi:MAG: hypothetical protein ACLP9L_04780 [Thermoguttaceae bacterium]